MIGTIRKHAGWLWWIIAALTIVSFIWWGASPGTRYGSGRHGGLGMLYGKPVTPEALDAAKREFFIEYWARNKEFPSRAGGLTQAEMDRNVYERLILQAKARELGIHVSDDAAAALGSRFLQSLGREGRAPTMGDFSQRILEPAGLTAGDFQRFLVSELVIQQLMQSLGLPGALVTPQEAGDLYDHDHQEVSAQAVFFSATNYLSQVAITPALVGQFYTNHMAEYRLPARVQINYVQYELTNFFAAAEHAIGSTNLAARVESVYTERGLDAVPGAKTPEEAKAKIREQFIRQEAAREAMAKARDFVNVLFRMEPVAAENLVALAKTNGLAIHTTAPFSEAEGPEDLAASTELVQAAFKLNADSPFYKPIVDEQAVYVIGLNRQLPSSIPALGEIHDRVTEDFRNYEGASKARAAGTNFYFNAAVQMATGKSFAQAALAGGQAPVALRPFSLSSEEIPDAQAHADVREVKAAAFSTQPGHLSPFRPTAEGGFVMFVQALLPVDETFKKSELPGFLSQMRRSRENEAFNMWLIGEENRELKNTPVYDELTAAKSAPNNP